MSESKKMFYSVFIEYTQRIVLTSKKVTILQFEKELPLVLGSWVCLNQPTVEELDQTLRIRLGTKFSQPTPELGPLQAEF